MAAEKMEFVEAVKLSISRLTDFKGRSRRSEFWWFVLAAYIASVIVAYLPFVGIALCLVISLLTLPSYIRRMHDIGKSGWSILISLIPLVGSIILIIWCAKDSEPGENKWGKNPKE